MTISCVQIQGGCLFETRRTQGRSKFTDYHRKQLPTAILHWDASHS